MEEGACTLPSPRLSPGGGRNKSLDADDSLMEKSKKPKTFVLHHKLAEDI
jgi:hypothetical protein